MLLHTVRFLCSVIAAFARLVRELRKAQLTATACSPVDSAPVAAAPPPAGLTSAMPLALLDQVVGAPPVVVVGSEAAKQADESISKKTAAWPAATRWPTRLVIPLADDGAEVAAGWGAAAAPVNEADVEMEGEGFRVASRAGPRHAMEDAYAVITDKTDGDNDELAFYGVFDGHGGRATVDFVSERLGKNVVSAVLAAGTRDQAKPSAEEDAVSAAIRAAYLATDSELLAQHQRWVVADPGVARVRLDAGCEFLVVATDGLWDKVGNQEAVDAVAWSRETACRELVDMARRRGSRDDVTVMVVDLERFVR